MARFRGFLYNSLSATMSAEVFPMEFVATGNRGLEEILADEIRGLGLHITAVSPASVTFSGNEEEMWRANLQLRSSRRILLPLEAERVRSAQELYEAARTIEWHHFLNKRMTFAVEASIRDSVFGHSGFVALKVKDAIADSLRDRSGGRPNVDRGNPDVRVMVRIIKERCDFSLDTSGTPLHKRGYRKKGIPGMLNESIAAGMVLASGYDGTKPLYDPFCGSGTIAIEAAMIASGTPPGLVRKGAFAFERWPGFRKNSYKKIIDNLKNEIHTPASAIFASDVSSGAVKVAKINASAAGVDEYINFESRNCRNFKPSSACGFIVSNPPYGDSSGELKEVPELYSDFGTVLKHSCAGFTAWLLAGNDSLRKSIGLKPKSKMKIYNGPKPCTLLEYRLFEGTLREEKRRP